MDIKIWEDAIVVWLNSLSACSPISSVNQINDSLLKAVVRKISANSESSTVEFLKKNFQNLIDSDSFQLSLGVDYLCVSTLLLIYASLSSAEHLKDIRDFMCTKLDTSTQISIVKFLTDLQEYEDVFSFSYKRFKSEVFPQIFLNFKERHCAQKISVVGDGASTPFKDVSNKSFNSPLQGFFQTPKRSVNKCGKCSYAMCGDGDYIKRIQKLTDQLVEEESEKNSLQEQLNIQTKTCIEFDLKLKNKIEEMNHLKEEWERDSKNNEAEFKMLKLKLMDKLENEKKLKNELTHMEKYISKLEADVSNFGSENEKLENQLISSLDQFMASEKQLRETTELCSKLQTAIGEKEKELEQFKEHYSLFYNDDKAIDVSFMNGSLDRSVCSPENLGVEMVDVLLREKIEENNSLQETIEELKAEKMKFINEVSLLNEQLVQKCSIISELQFLKNDLSSKVESFEKTEKELFKLQQDLLCANAEITKLNKENIHLNEKYNILNSKLQDREQVLINSNNSKMLLQINFLKLAEDLKAVQQRLELEVTNISRLTQSNYEKLSKLEGNVKPGEIHEVSDFAPKRNGLNNLEENLAEIKEEMTKLDFLLADEKFSKLAELLDNFETSFDWPESKTSLRKTCSLLNENVILLKVKVREFEEQQRILLDAQIRSEEQLKGAKEKIMELQSLSCLEIKKFTRELEEKNSKIKELEDAIRNLNKVGKELWMDKENTMKPGKVTGAVTETDSKNVPEDKSSRKTVSDVAETKMEAPLEHPEFSDSLEEVAVINKTFDIVNLGESHISDKTFSIKKKNLEAFSKDLKGESAWVVSPPSKVPLKKPVKEAATVSDGRRVQGESWVVPAGPAKLKVGKVKKVFSSLNDLRMKPEDEKLTEIQKENAAIRKECEFYKTALWESEQKRRKDREFCEKNHKNITAKYESQLEYLKSEMKQLYNRELAKHKLEQSSLNSELQDQNKRYKEHIDELRNHLWDLGEKLLQQQTLVRDMKRNNSELKENYENLIFSREADMKSMQVNDLSRQRESSVDERNRTSSLRPIPNATFPTMPTEDEDEVFDNRFLEDMKMGVCKTERPEDRLKELQYRNSLCLPHLKSSYPGETQFHSPTLFKESELKLGLLQFAQESQSLTDSDHSMTRSLLPDSKGKKKEQTSYKKPGPPTPSKNGGRLSIQSGDLKVTPRNVLKELNEQNERNRGTPNPLKLFLSTRGIRRRSVATRDENAAAVTPRKSYIFRKPFGARDH